jgi:hypothetical protein
MLAPQPQSWTAANAVESGATSAEFAVQTPSFSTLHAPITAAPASAPSTLKVTAKPFQSKATVAAVSIADAAPNAAAAAVSVASTAAATTTLSAASGVAASSASITAQQGNVRLNEAAADCLDFLEAGCAQVRPSLSTSRHDYSIVSFYLILVFALCPDGIYCVTLTFRAHRAMHARFATARPRAERRASAAHLRTAASAIDRASATSCIFQRAGACPSWWRRRLSRPRPHPSRPLRQHCRRRRRRNRQLIRTLTRLLISVRLFRHFHDAR